MTTLREAAQQALEALEKCTKHLPVHFDSHFEAISAIRAALAEPVQEPVAWAVYDIKHGGSKTLHWPEQHSPNGDPSQFKAVPLYSAPPQRKPLNEDQMNEAYIYIWRNLPSGFGHTASEWIDVGIRYAERIHGIK